ncbi:MAG: hypothetical protein GXP47_10775 [Acidobacteria bacterium]|nr:hypothetical protein [Acidobacteriota bacterium]
MTDDPAASRLILRLEGTIVAPVEILPQRRLWLTAFEGQASEKELLLRRHDGKPLHVTSLDVNNPELIEATFEEVTKAVQHGGLNARSGDVWIHVRLKPQMAAISRSTRVNVTTDDPEAKLVNIPVSIRIRARVEAIPPQVQLSLPPEGGKGAHRVLHIRNNMGGKIKVLAIASDHPEDFTAELVSKQPSSDQVITVRVTDQAAEKELRTRVFGKLLVTTDDPGAREIRVPVVLWRMPQRRPVPPGQSRVIRRGVAPTPPGGIILHARPGRPTPVEKPAPAPTPLPH